MNAFELLTVLGGVAVILSFLSGCRPRHRDSFSRNRRVKPAGERYKIFDFAVGLTILAALLA